MTGMDKKAEGSNKGFQAECIWILYEGYYLLWGENMISPEILYNKYEYFSQFKG